MLKILFQTTIALLLCSASMANRMTTDATQGIVIKRDPSTAEKSLGEIQSTMIQGVEQAINQSIQSILTVNSADAVRCRQDTDCEIFPMPNYCGLGARHSINKEFKFLPYMKELSAAYNNVTRTSNSLYQADSSFFGMPCPAMALMPVDPKCENRRCVAKTKSPF